MRIGFDAKRLFHNRTGLGNYSRDLLRMLYQYYPENQYFLYNPKPAHRYDQILKNVSYTERNPKGLWKNAKSFWRSYGVKKQILKDRLDVYHGLSGELPIGIKGKVKTVVTIHDLIFLRYPGLYSPFDRKSYFIKFRSAVKRADKIIAISEQTKRDIVQFLKINPEKIEVIYQGCGAEFKKTYSDEEKLLLRQKYGLPERFILSVGTVEKRKNALQIVKAIREIDTVLVLVGKKTAYFNEIEEFVFKNKMQNKVIHLQGLTPNELAMLYQLADIFIYPSVFEGFGIPIIEALFSKTPVITNQNGVFPEAGGSATSYVDVEDVDSLSSAILKILEDNHLREKMADEGFEFVQKFNDHHIARQWMSLYQNMVL